MADRCACDARELARGHRRDCPANHWSRYVHLPRPGECHCFLPTKPPDGADWWRPDLDDDPGPGVQAVVRYGEDPTLRRAVRVEAGWVEKGALVAFYENITPPMPWRRTGICWADTPHPVVQCEAWPL